MILPYLHSLLHISTFEHCLLKNALLFTSGTLHVYNCFMPGSFGRCFDCASLASHEGHSKKEACSVVRTQTGVPNNLFYLFDIGRGSPSPATLHASWTKCLNSHLRSFLHIKFAVTLDFTFFIASHVYLFLTHRSVFQATGSPRITTVLDSCMCSSGQCFQHACLYSHACCSDEWPVLRTLPGKTGQQSMLLGVWVLAIGHLLHFRYSLRLVTESTAASRGSLKFFISILKTVRDKPCQPP